MLFYLFYWISYSRSLSSVNLIRWFFSALLLTVYTINDNLYSRLLSDHRFYPLSHGVCQSTAVLLCSALCVIPWVSWSSANVRNYVCVKCLIYQRRNLSKGALLWWLRSALIFFPPGLYLLPCLLDGCKFTHVQPTVWFFVLFKGMTRVAHFAQYCEWLWGIYYRWIIIVHHFYLHQRHHRCFLMPCWSCFLFSDLQKNLGLEISSIWRKRSRSLWWSRTNLWARSKLILCKPFSL